MAVLKYISSLIFSLSSARRLGSDSLAIRIITSLSPQKRSLCVQSDSPRDRRIAHHSGQKTPQPRLGGQESSYFPRDVFSLSPIRSILQIGRTETIPGFHFDEYEDLAILGHEVCFPVSILDNSFPGCAAPFSQETKPRPFAPSRLFTP